MPPVESGEGSSGAVRARGENIDPDALPDRHRKHAQLTVMLGLFVTFGGLFGYAVQVPAQPTALDEVVPWLLVGFVCTWSGGIFGGNSLVPPPPGIPPALRGQAGVAGIATIAGALAATVAALRVGPWVAPAAGTPAELVIAAVAAATVWVGGFMMGRSMRRFVRRRRRASAPGGTDGPPMR